MTVLLFSTKYYSSTTPVVQSITSIRFCTIIVLQSDMPDNIMQILFHNPILFCATKYFSNISLYFKVPLRHMSFRLKNSLRATENQCHQMLHLPRTITLIMNNSLHIQHHLHYTQYPNSVFNITKYTIVPHQITLINNIRYIY